MKTLKQILDAEAKAKKEKYIFKTKKIKVYKILINDLINILDCEADLFYKTRQTPFASIRHVIAHLMHLDGFSGTEIGIMLKKERTTIINSVRASKNLLETNDEFFKEIYDEILRLISIIEK